MIFRRHPIITRPVRFLVGQLRLGRRLATVDMPGRGGLDGLAPMTALAAATLLVAALGGSFQRQGWMLGSALFWIAFCTLFAVIAYRVYQPAPSRPERLSLVLIAATAIYMLVINQEPGSVRQFDEFLHWVTASDIRALGRLFEPNPLLPISPYYPGLELATVGLSHLTGLPVVPAGQIVVGVARFAGIASLFFIYERVSGSSRFAGIATLAYMGHSSFAGFHAQFAYESLAVPLLLLTLFIYSEIRARKADRYLGGALLVIAAVVLTHHITAAILIALLWAIWLFEVLPLNESENSSWRQRSALILAAFGATGLVSWSLIPGNPLMAYFGPIMSDAAGAVMRLITFASSARIPFQASDGESNVLGIRLFGSLAYLIVAASLCYGILAFLFIARAEPSDGRIRHGRHWLSYRNSLVLVLAGLAVLFPVTVLLRLTQHSWELGHRLSSFCFIGVAITVAMTLLLPEILTHNNRVRGAIAAGVLTCLFVGGVATGGESLFLPGSYRAAADSRSIERTGIESAKWSREWLGCGNRFGADRTNRVLLATYGCQTVSTSIADGVDISGIVGSPDVTPADIQVIRKARLDYLAVDMRLTTVKPTFGIFFDGAEEPLMRNTPLNPIALTKFRPEGGFSRVYDNGLIQIYGLRGRHVLP